MVMLQTSFPVNKLKTVTDLLAAILVAFNYGKRSLFWSLIIFAYLSFTTVQGQKIGFNSCECIKFFNIANIHVLDVWR